MPWWYERLVEPHYELMTMTARKRTPAKPKPDKTPPAIKEVEVVRTKSSAPSWVMVALVAAAVGYYVFRSERGRLPQPEPQPRPASVQMLVAEARKSLLAEYGNAFEQTSKGVESGEIKTAKQVYESLGPATKKAREQAFAGIDQHMSTSMPRDVDTLKPEAAKFFSDIAEAFKKEAR